MLVVTDRDRLERTFSFLNLHFLQKKYICLTEANYFFTSFSIGLQRTNLFMNLHMPTCDEMVMDRYWIGE